MNAHTRTMAGRTIAAAVTFSMASVMAIGNATTAQAATPVDTTATYLRKNDSSNTYYPIVNGVRLSSAVPPMVLHLRGDQSGQDISAYCIEMDVPVSSALVGKAGAYVAKDWNTYQSQSDIYSARQAWADNKHKVLWILANSYPQKSGLETMRDLGVDLGITDPTVADLTVRDATQMAIWHFANGADWDDKWWSTQLQAWQYGFWGSDVERVYSALLARAEKAPVVTNVPPSISFDNAKTTNVAGTVFEPITLKTTSPATVNATLPTGATLTIGNDTFTGTVDVSNVPDGTRMTLAVPDTAAAGSVDISAQAMGEVPPIGTVWFAPGSQSLITAKAAKQLVQATTQITWTAKPANPALSTTATDKADGDKTLAATGGTIVDRVDYTGLVPGTKYTVSGELMDKATGKSTGITAHTEFTPTAANGSVNVEFAVPASLAGSTLVVFETLLTGATNGTGGTTVATHTDIDDAAQTVTVAKPAPTFATTATDQADGDKLISAWGGTVSDVVTYTNLEVGQTYTVKGELMDKATGAATGIKAETTFTATSANGSVTVVFDVPAGFEGKDLVAFEKAYDASGKLVGEHTDITDAEQTVSVNTPLQVGTTATDKADGDKTLAPEGGTIKDVVAFQGLEVGKTYVISGELMNKADGSATGITASTTFVAKTATDSVALDFAVPAGFDGRSLVAFETVSLADASGKPVKEVGSHKDITSAAQTVAVAPKPVVPATPAPTFATTATDQADGDKLISSFGGTVVDVVTYTNLEVGTTYTVKGELMDKATGKGTGITGETTFTATTADGSVKVVFDVPAGFAGKDLVAFEKAYDASGALVGEHTDITDAKQTVTVNSTMTVGTVATDKVDGDHVITADGGTIIDAVKLTGLEVGKTYRIDGELMDKADGSATGITGSTEFTATAADQTVEVEFTVPAGHGGTTFVAFETVYQGSQDGTGGVEVGSHKDIDDAAQTVLVEKPVAPAPKPVIGTTATDKADGDKLVSPDGGVVKDVVSYQNLVPGQTYLVSGQLMVKDGGAATGITGQAEFTADADGTGTVDVFFTVTPKFAGQELVAFESVFAVSPEGKPGAEPVAKHTDITDAAQTVTVNHTIAVSTSAKDQADGDKVIAADGGKVLDVVTYEGLEPGKSYTLTGELMDKATGKGTGITGETTFTAEKSSGTATVVFTVPAGHAGATLVAFEKLFVNGTDGKPGTTPIGSHEDIDDAAQTVTVQEPTAPTTPAPTPSTPAPAPSTPAPTPSTPAPAPSTPAPTPSTPAPAPSTPAPTPTRPGVTKPGSVPMVTRTFQVDAYLPRTAADARLVASLDDDGLLKYREDRRMWGKSRWQFVTIKVRANATRAEIVKAINAKTNRTVGDVGTTKKLTSTKAGRRVTVAWELGKGATTELAWGAKKNIAQTFFARS